MTSVKALSSYFKRNSEYTVKGKNPNHRDHIYVGKTDNRHHGKWVVIDDSYIMYKNDGVAGSPNTKEKYDKLNRDEAIENIDDFLFDFN